MSAGSPVSKHYEDIRAWVQQVDPELVEAEAEVDISMLEAASRRTPLENLRKSVALASELLRLRELPRL